MSSPEERVAAYLAAELVLRLDTDSDWQERHVDVRAMADTVIRELRQEGVDLHSMTVQEFLDRLGEDTFTVTADQHATAEPPRIWDIAYFPGYLRIRDADGRYVVLPELHAEQVARSILEYLEDDQDGP